MKKSYTIPKERDLLKSMDFDVLKQEGISLLQQFSGDIWTDYNDHDPGVTLLEQLCFMLTEVSYRSGFGIEEILYAGKKHGSKGEDEEPGDTFFEANEILPSHPITLKDYRKLLIDQIPEVKNAWIEPELGLVQEKKGIYKVFLQLEEGVPEEKWPRIERLVTQKLQAFRNLGEDFGTIDVLSYEEIAISATIELKYNALGEEVLGKLIADLEAYLTPNIRKYSLQELLEEGVPLEKIMDGPLLMNGFIQDEDLLPRTQLIRKSKFTEIITSIDGAEKVSRFELLKNGITFLGDILSIPEGRIPRLFDYLNPEKNNLTSYIRFTKGGKPYTINPNLVHQIYASQAEKFQKTFIKKTDLTILPALASKKPEYQRLDLKEYFSLQRYLPAIYGVGEFGLSREDSVERVARAKQLKAYLLIFDQLLANHLAQLTSLRTLFSLYEETPENEESRRSYFFQPADDVPEIESVLLKDEQLSTYRPEIEGHLTTMKTLFQGRRIRFAWVRELKVFDETATQKGFNQALENLCKGLSASIQRKLPSQTNEDQIALRNNLEKKVLAFKMACIRTVFRTNLDSLMRDIDPYLNRRNQFLDHLLARFGETTGGIQPTLLTKGTGGDFNKDLIASKLNVLKNYPILSRTRSGGAVFVGGRQGVEVSGLQKRLGAALNFDHSYRRLAAFLRPSTQSQAKLKFYKKRPEAEESPKRFTFALPPENKEEMLAVLVSHGLHDYNYEIVKVDPEEKVGTGNYEIKFIHPLFATKTANSTTPPDRKDYFTINSTKTRQEAEKALASLIRYFNKLNEQGEGCHLVEHLLLRPLSPNPERFEILDTKANVILKSFRPRSKAVQSFIAANITLYATRGLSLMKYQKEGKYKLFFGEEYLGYEILDPEVQHYQPREIPDPKVKYPMFEWVRQENDGYGNRVDAAFMVKDKIHLFNGQDSNFRLIERSDGKFEVVLSGENHLGEVEDVARLVNPKNTERKTIREERILDSNESVQEEEEFLFDTETDAIKQRDKVIAEFIDMRLQNKLISRLQMKTVSRSSETSEFYSQQCTLVLPNWPARFQRHEFKTQIKKLVIQYAPAHLQFNYLWLDPEEMNRFESLYERWRKLKGQSSQAEPEKIPEILVNLDRASQQLAASLKHSLDERQ